MDKDRFARIAAVVFAAIVMVYGSVVLQQCSMDHPIIFDRDTGKTVSVW